ncbi:MAG TPA: T9SS type A sorting domain-containing protein, partial [Bacteroidales bacterium]|nr:T9SS type A sorting domain-containing protein [Bacteroidales bacterium]
IYGFAEDVYTATCDMPLDAKVFLQGPYDMYTDLMKTDLAGVIPTGAYPAGRQPFTGNPWLYNGTENLGSVPAGMVDWVLVELRTGTGAGTMAYRQAGLLFSDGTIRSAADPAKDIFFASDPTDLMPNSDFYIVVYHRNHMPVMSGAPVNIPNSAMLNLTDLTQAYGYIPASAVEQPLITLETGVYGMIAGDHYGAIPAGEGWSYFDYPDGWLYYSGNPNDRDPILAGIVSVTGLPYINGVINNVYFKEDLTMNRQVKYSGSGNDPRLIIQNLIELKGSNVLTNFYESKVPGWAIPHVKKEGLLSMTGPLDIGLYEAPRELLINITANETFTGAMVSNIQFTLCWDENNPEAGRLIAGYQSDFLLEPQGVPVKFAGKIYQVFATVEPVALPDPLNSGEQVTVMRFAKSDAAPVAANGLAIADNAWTLANNGGYYIAVWGAGQTGRIVTEALGADQPGDPGPVVRIYPNPTATGWIYLTTNPAVSGNLAVRLTDLTGRQLRQCQWSVKPGMANAMTFDLEGLSHGAYLLNINGESFSFSERIIIR